MLTRKMFLRATQWRIHNGAPGTMVSACKFSSHPENQPPISSGKLPYFSVAQAQDDKEKQQTSTMDFVQRVLAKMAETKEALKAKATPGNSESAYVSESIVTSSSSVTESKPSFDYFVVVDFEATCDSTVFFPQEIIEFPSVLVEAKSLKVEDSFQTYVKPLYNPQLTDFCKKLTGIEQNQVDNGVPLARALEQHDKWLEDRGVKEKHFGVITWTDWDCKTMLELECKLKGLPKPPYFDSWINLKPVFETHYKVKGRLKQAVLRAGLVWEGREHCGLDDAKNTAFLAIELMKQGVQLDYTSTAKKEAKKESFVPRIQKILDGSKSEAVKSVPAPGLCFCGVKYRARLVTKAGPNKGKYFISCGHWTITKGGKCAFYRWETAENTVT